MEESVEKDNLCSFLLTAAANGTIKQLTCSHAAQAQKMLGTVYRNTAGYRFTTTES